jgi:hypothetical protein
LGQHIHGIVAANIASRRALSPARDSVLSFFARVQTPESLVRQGDGTKGEEDRWL